MKKFIILAFILGLIIGIFFGAAIPTGRERCYKINTFQGINTCLWLEGYITQP